MKQKPRNPRASIFTGGLGIKIGIGGFIIGGLSLTVYKIGLGDGLKTAQTMTFAVLSLHSLLMH